MNYHDRGGRIALLQQSCTQQTAGTEIVGYLLDHPQSFGPRPLLETSLEIRLFQAIEAFLEAFCNLLDIQPFRRNLPRHIVDERLQKVQSMFRLLGHNYKW